MVKISINKIKIILDMFNVINAIGNMYYEFFYNIFIMIVYILTIYNNININIK